MRRLARAIIVACLAVTVSGAARLIVQEPCTASEEATRGDGACAPTCVTCGCCAQAMEPVAIVLASVPATPAVMGRVPLPSLIDTDPRDILHVPKA